MKSCIFISLFLFWIKFSMLSASIFKCPNNLLSPFHTFLKISSSQCSHKMISSLSDWKFSQPSSLLSFPIDPIPENYVRRVPKCIFSRVTPQPLKSELSLVSCSDDVLEEVLDLDPRVKSEPLFTNFIAGNELLPGCDPMAHRYGGFQFGYWADQLGDGRAILLGEYINRKGERWELQLKGAGKTPYSRNGDGRAVLRSSIREFLASEAMEALGIATSRAAGIVVSKVAVIRDQFYNGRVKAEPAAVVLRLAKSWFRIGSLEILQRENELDNLKQVTDFVLKNCYPGLGLGDYLKFFEKMVEDSALLVAKWMTVGFAHGVLNTDNMSLLSITIDYGPYGFLDAYEPGFIPNHSDDAGRYSYENQPRVFKWNLGSLARAISPLVAESDRPKLGEILSKFESIFEEFLMTEFRKKFGLLAPHPEEAKLIQMFLDMMEIRRADFTQTFRQLSKLELTDGLETDFDSLWALKSISAHPNFAEFVALYRRVAAETGSTETNRRNLMDRTNPQYVLRNWMAEAAIRAAQGDGSGNSTNQQPDFEPTNLLLRILKRPYDVDPEAEASGFSGPPPSWACSLKVSCSS